jgi:hypothetical protein
MWTDISCLRSGAKKARIRRFQMSWRGGTVCTNAAMTSHHTRSLAITGFVNICPNRRRCSAHRDLESNPSGAIGTRFSYRCVIPAQLPHHASRGAESTPPRDHLAFKHIWRTIRACSGRLQHTFFFVGIGASATPLSDRTALPKWKSDYLSLVAEGARSRIPDLGHGQPRSVRAISFRPVKKLTDSSRHIYSAPMRAGDRPEQRRPGAA